MMKRLPEETPVVHEEREFGRLGPKDPHATGVVLAAGEARAVEEALNFRAARKRAVEAWQAFEVIRGGHQRKPPRNSTQTPHNIHPTTSMRLKCSCIRLFLIE